MTLILSPLPLAQEPQSQHTPLAAGGSNHHHNGGSTPPPVAAGQSDSNDNTSIDLARIAREIARSLQQGRQTRREAQ